VFSLFSSSALAAVRLQFASAIAADYLQRGFDPVALRLQYDFARLQCAFARLQCAFVRLQFASALSVFRL